MTSRAKFAWVAVGYASAFLLSVGAVAIHSALTDGPDRQASGGMYAFGDLVLFIGLFSTACLLPTGAGLYLLRPFLAFWRGLSATSIAISATNLIAVAIYLAARTATPGSSLAEWSVLAVLRILSAPVFALGFLLSGIMAPQRPARIALFVASFIEGTAFLIMLVAWFGGVARS